MNEFSVYIGRFQPFHIAHLNTVRFALERSKRLIIVLGSDNQATTTKNPWMTAERIAMISGCLSTEELSRVTFVPIRDHLYNENLWIADVQRSVKAYTGTSNDVALVGHVKDGSSFYLKLFPQWTYVSTSELDMPHIDATKIRELMFRLDKIGIKPLLPKSVYEDVCAFMETDEFKRLHEEHHHIREYKAQWAGAPFPPTFNTVDAIVFCSGHVLVVRRGGKLGKGLIALPGGFLNTNERTVDGCVRELREETGIKLLGPELKSTIVAEKVFDHPDRSLRGRTITHAFCFNLKGGKLPEVKGMDDADKAWWMPLDEFYKSESKFFEDHHAIVSYFIGRV